MRVLLYVDSPAMMPSAVAIGRALEQEMAGVGISMLLVNAGKHRSEIPPAFAVHDLAESAATGAGARSYRAILVSRTIRLTLLILFFPFIVVALARGQGKTDALDTIQLTLREMTGGLRHFLLRFRLVRNIRAIQTTRSFGRTARAFLARTNPDVIIVFEDNIETMTRVLVEMGRRSGVPSIIVPYTIPNPLEPATALATSRDHAAGPWDQRILGQFKSRWVFHFEGRPLMRLPVMRAIAMERMGLSVPRPWVLNSGPAAAIALDSEASRRSYLRLAFPAEQLEVVGDPVNATLHDGLVDRADLRRRLVTAHALEERERPIVVCAFPPDQYRGTEIGAYEFPDFEQMVSSWMSVLTEISGHANVLVRPHPRLDHEVLRKYESSRLRVTLAPTAELVPAADLYIASISATIRWAIACGIPVVNYDCYRYHYDDYEEASGVLTVYDQSAFRDIVKRFLSDPPFAESLRTRQRAVMGDWGVVDTAFAARFAALASRVSSTHPFAGEGHGRP